MNRNPTVGILLILAAAVLWGTSGTAQSFATPALSAYWIGSVRLVVAALFFAAWIALGAASRSEAVSPAPAAHPSTSQRWPGVVGAALSMTLYNLAFFAGVRESGVALGTALALGSAPLWAGLLEGLLGRRLPSLLWWLGVGIAVAGLGTALITTDGGAVRMHGVAFCLVAGLAYALYARCTKRLIVGGSPLRVTGGVFALAALAAVPLAWTLAGTPAFTAMDVVVLLWLGVASTGIAYFLFALGIHHVPSATAVALGMAEPVAAVVFAIGLVGERPSGMALAGLMAVLAGLALLVRADSGSHG